MKPYKRKEKEPHYPQRLKPPKRHGKRPFVIEWRTQWWRICNEWQTWKRYETEEQMLIALKQLLKTTIKNGRKWCDFRIKPNKP